MGEDWYSLPEWFRDAYDGKNEAGVKTVISLNNPPRIDVVTLEGVMTANIEDWIIKGANWLQFCQNADGGWGETCATYDNPNLKGQGESTPSQTAWALMGMIAATDHMRPSILRGVEYLARTQNPDGSWTEDHITGTGFPKVFYHKNDMYRNNWPLLALADFRALAARDRR